MDTRKVKRTNDVDPYDLNYPDYTESYHASSLFLGKLSLVTINTTGETPVSTTMEIDLPHLYPQRNPVVALDHFQRTFNKDIHYRKLHSPLMKEAL